MKQFSSALSRAALFLSLVVVFISCKKINEATELGDDLVPEVDNISTFETYFSTITENKLLQDTTKLLYSDNVALGYIGNDPEFGSTNANLFFSISAPAYGSYPFTSKENLVIDSVVLQLAYATAYGDSNSFQKVQVYEIAPPFRFSETGFFKFNDPQPPVGNQLGTATYRPIDLNDSISIIRKDTQRTANVLRIRLDNQLGYRLSNFDTAFGNNGGYNNDSIFRTLVPGIAVKTDEATGNVLSYFDISDAKTNLTVYYRASKNSTTDTSSVVYTHARNGQANIITRNPGGMWANYLTNGSSDLIFIQSAPGSYASIRIPSLDTFSNNVIHRAELIVSKTPSTQDNIFTPPFQLFLDRINTAGDTAFILNNDMAFNSDLSPNFGSFGGRLRPDGTYRFNITKHVQNIITRGAPNQVLRLYAPFETRPVTAPFLNNGTNIPIVVTQQGYGRLAAGGGTYPDPERRLRLRIVYSRL